MDDFFTHKPTTNMIDKTLKVIASIPGTRQEHLIVIISFQLQFDFGY